MTELFQRFGLQPRLKLLRIPRGVYSHGVHLQAVHNSTEPSFKAAATIPMQLLLMLADVILLAT